jgi:hypothetical protein
MAISMRFYSLGSNNRHGNGHEGKGKFIFVFRFTAVRLVVESQDGYDSPIERKGCETKGRSAPQR